MSTESQIALTLIKRIMGIEKQIAGYDVWLDPDAITSVDIDKGDSKDTLVRILLQDEDEPRVHKFDTKAEALDFYKAVWKGRGETHDEVRVRASSR